MARKKPTEQELKDKLWEMAQMVNWPVDGSSGFDDLEDWDDWLSVMIARGAKKLSIPGFEIDAPDLNKIRTEVQDSCLSDETKKNIQKALKAVKVK